MPSYTRELDSETMQLLVCQTAIAPNHHKYFPREHPAVTPHSDLTCSVHVSKNPGACPNELSSLSSDYKQTWTILPNGADEIHGTVNVTSKFKPEEVKTLDMTPDASLPPSAPITRPATLEDITHPHDERNGYGEVHASLDSMPQSSISLEQTCADLHDRVSRFLAIKSQDPNLQQTQEQSRITLGVIQEALERYDFEALSLSYNGGKDCLVLLILYLAALHTHFSKKASNQNQSNGAGSNTGFPTYIPSIYAKPPDPFPEVTSFVETSTKAYHLSLTHIATNPGSQPKYRSHTSPPTTPATDEGEPVVTFRDAFALYLATNPKVQAIFVGTRRTDPHGGKLTFFDMTDGNWPRFMRIHPVIDWQLSDVWTFLRHPALADIRIGEPLQYCSIYDKGYTSLGGVGDTLRNPKLKYRDEEGHEKYRPAYEMTEDRGERLGRE